MHTIKRRLNVITVLHYCNKGSNSAVHVKTRYAINCHYKPEMTAAFQRADFRFLK